MLNSIWAVCSIMQIKKFMADFLAPMGLYRVHINHKKLQIYKCMYVFL